MSDASNEPAPADLELAILQTLVSQLQARPQSSETNEIRTSLAAFANHRWHEQEHRIVYECVCAAINHSRSLSLREEMAGEATRKGHPDVDWNLYFAHPDADTNLAKLIGSLKTQRGAR